MSVAREANEQIADISHQSWSSISPVQVARKRMLKEIVKCSNNKNPYISVQKSYTIFDIQYWFHFLTNISTITFFGNVLFFWWCHPGAQLKIFIIINIKLNQFQSKLVKIVAPIYEYTNTMILHKNQNENIANSDIDLLDHINLHIFNFYGSFRVDF